MLTSNTDTTNTLVNNKRLTFTKELILKIKELRETNPKWNGRQISNEVGAIDNKDYQLVCYQLRKLNGKTRKARKKEKLMSIEKKILEKEVEVIDSKVKLAKLLTSWTAQQMNEYDNLPDTVKQIIFVKNPDGKSKRPEHVEVSNDQVKNFKAKIVNDSIKNMVSLLKEAKGSEININQNMASVTSAERIREIYEETKAMRVKTNG